MNLDSYKSESLWKAVIILSIFGIILASYLLYNTLDPNPFKVCSVNAWINCDPVTKGSLAYLFGIPVAFIGLVGYFVILAAGITRQKKLLIGMTTFGMLFCLRLLFLEIFVERILCPVCILCQMTMLSVFVLGIALNKRKETNTEKFKMILSRLFNR